MGAVHGYLVPAFGELGQVESGPVHVCPIKEVMGCIFNQLFRKEN